MRKVEAWRRSQQKEEGRNGKEKLEKEGMVRTVRRQERSDRGVCEVVSRVVMELVSMFVL